MQTAKAFQEQVEAFTAWLDATERRAQSKNDVAATPADIERQMDEQARLQVEVRQHKPELDDVIVLGGELSKRCDGDEASKLNERLDELKKRYADVTSAADARFALLEGALPLASNVAESHRKLCDDLQRVEAELNAPEKSGAEAEEHADVRPNS